MTRLIQFLFKNLINIGSSILKEASHKRSYLWYLPHTIISLIRESWTLSNSHLQLNFLNSVTVLALLLPVCENLWQRMVIFFLRLQHFSSFLNNACEKNGSLYFITLGIFFCCSQIKIKVLEPKFPAMRYIAVK